MEFSTTQRGACSLIYQGYKYTFNRRWLDGRIYWRCNYRSCSGRTTTEGDKLISCNNNHNHPPRDKAEVQAEKVISSLRKKISKTIQPVPLLYSLSRRQEKNKIAAKLPTLPLIKSSLYQECRKDYLQCPIQRKKLCLKVNGRKLLVVSDSYYGVRHKLSYSSQQKTSTHLQVLMMCLWMEHSTLAHSYSTKFSLHMQQGMVIIFLWSTVCFPVSHKKKIRRVITLLKTKSEE